MNAYTTRTQARIQPCDIARALFTDLSVARLSLETLERTRGFQAEAEMARLLKQNGVPLAPASPWVVMLRQMLGAALVRAGHRLAPVPPRGTSRATALADGTLRTVR